MHIILKVQMKISRITTKSEVSKNITEMEKLTVLIISPKPKQQRRRKTSYLRSKIWNRHNHKNKASNNVI